MIKLNRTLLAAGAIASALAFGSTAATAGVLDKLSSDKFSSEQLASIKVNIADAIIKAQASQPGTVTQAELKDDNGKLVYQVEFTDNGQEKQVVVDAVNGEVRPAGNS
jgi:uncharacterized membrane protein YkoI